MSPIKAAWVIDPEQRDMLTGAFDRGHCRDLVCKMAKGGEAFTKDDKLAYEWLIQNMSFFLKGTIYEQLVPAFEMALTNAWAGGEKVFFDLELLSKLDVALDVFLTDVISQSAVLGGFKRLQLHQQGL